MLVGHNLSPIELTYFFGRLSDCEEMMKLSSLEALPLAPQRLIYSILGLAFARGLQLPAASSTTLSTRVSC